MSVAIFFGKTERYAQITPVVACAGIMGDVTLSGNETREMASNELENALRAMCHLVSDQCKISVHGAEKNINEAFQDEDFAKTFLKSVVYVANASPLSSADEMSHAQILYKGEGPTVPFLYAADFLVSSLSSKGVLNQKDLTSLCDRYSSLKPVSEIPEKTISLLRDVAQNEPLQSPKPNVPEDA